MNNRFKDEGLEWLVAQLYSVDNYTTANPDITPTPTFKIKWGDILGSISNQADLMDYLTHLQEEIDEAVKDLSNVYTYKGSVPTFNDLPKSDNRSGDVYNVEDTGANYAWTGTEWDKLSDTIDLENYVTKDTLALYYLKEEVDALIADINAYTKDEIDAFLADKADISDIYDKTEIDNKLNDKANANALSDEITARENADNDLQDAIDKVAEDLQKHIDDAETGYVTNAQLSEAVSALEQADAELQTAIDSKADASEVFDKTEIEALLENKADTFTELPQDAEIGITGQYVGENGTYTKGYFYECIGEPRVEFTPIGEECTTEVTVNLEDFKAYLETLCEGRDFTAEDIVSGQIGYHNLTDLYSFSAETADGKFFAISVPIEDLIEAGFTFEPMLSARQGVTFECNLTDDSWKQINVQPEQDVSGKADQSEVTALGDRVDTLETGLSNVYTKDEIDAKTSTLFNYKGQVNSENDLPAENNKVGDTYNVVDTGANYTWNGSAWDKLSETIDLSPYALAEDLSDEASARQDADADLQTAIEKVAEDLQKHIDDAETGYVTNAQLSEAVATLENADAQLQINIDKKVDKEITSANGKALIFNEVDGGGAKFEGATRNAFAGVNDMLDANQLGVQLYNIDKETKVGPRINLTAERATYSINKTEVGADYEILIKKDLSNFYTKAEIDNMTSTLFNYKGQVAKEENLPNENNHVGDTYNVQETGANYTWNGTAWDKLSETIDLSPYALNADLSEVSDRVDALENLDLVTYSDLSSQTYPNRKGILLDEDHGIYGKDSLERVKLISMISNDVVEFGAGSLQTNINTNGNLLINGEARVLSDKNIGSYILAGNNVNINVNTVVDGEDSYKTYTVNADLGSVQTAIENEADARNEADETLQENINAVSEDVTDLETSVNASLELKADKIDTYTKTETDNLLNKKTDKELTGTHGKALIFNETDGGGAKFETNDGHWSFAGVNDMSDANGIGVQLYNIDRNDNNVGPRINLTKDRATYSKIKTEVGEEYEILIKNDLTTAITALSETYYNKSEVDDLLQDMEVGQLRQDLDKEIQDRQDADGALEDRIELLEQHTQSIFHYKGNVATVADLENIQTKEIGDVYNVTDSGSNYCWDGENWDKLSETVDLSAYDLTADRETADRNIISKIWSNNTMNGGHFYTKLNNNQGGYALIFNEEDGGGSQVFDKTDNVKSYVGANLEEGTGADATAVNVQIYSLDDTSKAGTRLNVNTQGIYYVKGEKGQGNPVQREVAVKDDVDTVQGNVDILNGEFTNLSETVENTLANQDGNIAALLLKMDTLEQKIEDLKSLDYEVVVLYDGDETDYDNEEKSFQLSGAVNTRLIVTGENVTLDEATISSAYVNLAAIEDITIKNSSLTGIIPKTVTNAAVQVHADGYVSIRDCVFTPESCYNGIEVGLTNGLAKSVIIDNCRFDGTFSNNGINIFGMDDFGVVTISNCYFKELSNLLRISNRTNTHWTINLINCTCDKWETGQYAGAILLQDYTSGSSAAADTLDIFSKLTINIQNLTKPDGTKLVMPEDLSEICGTRDDNQIIYMYDSWRGHTAYGAKYPTITIQ